MAPPIGLPSKYHWLPLPALEVNTTGTASAQTAVGPTGAIVGAAGIAFTVTATVLVNVNVQPVVDDSGRIFARVANTSGVDLQAVTIEIAAVTGGRIARQTRAVRNLSANALVEVNSGLRIPEGQVLSGDQVQVRVVDAPLEAVVLGAGRCLESFELLQSIFIK